MIETRIIPVLLLWNRQLVKTVRFRGKRYVGDPINALKVFNEKECPEITLLDIGRAKDGRKPDFAYLSQLAGECFMPLAYGGGISSFDDAAKIFHMGFEKVIFNTASVKQPDLVTKISEHFGAQAVVVSIDVVSSFWGKRCVVLKGGAEKVSLDPVKHAKSVETLGAGEIIIHGVQQDGTMEGYDLKLISDVAQAVNIPVVALGGASKIEDFGRALDAGASACAAGSLFTFYGKQRAVLLNYPSDEELLHFVP